MAAASRPGETDDSAEFEQIVGGPDGARRDRAMRAMMTMNKLDLAALRAAADATPVA